MLSRWMNTTDAARHYELNIKHIGERSQHMIASFQQCSYVGLVASGALMVSSGDLTMGSLIACSILSGRILAPWQVFLTPCNNGHTPRPLLNHWMPYGSLKMTTKAWITQSCGAHCRSLPI